MRCLEPEQAVFLVQAREGSISRCCDVRVEHIPQIWPSVRPFIAMALAREGSARYAPADVLELLLGNKARLWISWNPDARAIEAAAVTDIIVFPRGLKELRIWLVGGRNMRAWVAEMRDMIEAYARANGCAFLSGSMRRGWIRIGGDGWRETGRTFEKRL